MSLIVLALVLWIVVVPALVVLAALYMPRGLLRRLTGVRADERASSNVTSIHAPDSAGFTRQSA